jgi:hypothetical protein
MNINNYDLKKLKKSKLVFCGKHKTANMFGKLPDLCFITLAEGDTKNMMNHYSFKEIVRELCMTEKEQWKQLKEAIAKI